MELFIDQIERRNMPLFSGICMQCQFMPDQYSDKSACDLFEQPLPIDMSTWVNKRKAEYVAGRYLAKLALNQLLQSLTPELNAGQRFRGDLSIAQNQVFTSIID